MTGAIDVHTHFVPRRMPSKAHRTASWPSLEVTNDDKAAIFFGGKLFRTIDSRSWDPGRRLDDMGLDGIDVQVVSPMPELLSHWFPAQDAEFLADHVNEELANLCASRPGRFLGLGMVPIQDPVLAVRRLETVKSLGLFGVEIGTHVNGMPLGDARMDDLYAAAEDLDLMIFIHPLHPAGTERIGGPPVMAAIAVFPLETALAATSLLVSAVPERFPRLRILLSHGGGALPWILPRLSQTRVLDPSLEGVFKNDPRVMARHFFYDSIVYDGAALRFLAETVGLENIVVGSDYPFSIRQTKPAEFASKSLPNAGEAFTKNALRLLNHAGMS